MIGHFIHALWRRIAPISHARAIGVTLGEGCRLIDVTFSSEPYLVTLGNRVSASGTHFETHDGGVWVLRQTYPELDRIAPITVGDNVFIGHGSIILPGVTIGSNVVIGAGSVVTRDIASDCVAAGVPARPIGSIADYADKALARGVMT